jgi:hypothetical protein
MELRPSLVGDRPRQLPVANHPGNMQIFHHDHRLGFRQCRGGLVQRIDALVADAAVTAGQRQHRPTAVG